MLSSAPISESAERAAREVLDAAFQIHTALGPGLLESVYEACLVHDLVRKEVPVRHQVPVQISYNGLHLEAGLRLDVRLKEGIRRFKPFFVSFVPFVVSFSQASCQRSIFQLSPSRPLTPSAADGS